MKVASVTALVLLLGTCGVVDAAVTLRQDFEECARGDAGLLGNPDDPGGQFGLMHPHPDNPPHSNRLADATDTAMQGGSNALAIVCGAAESHLGKREHWRIVRSTPLCGPDSAFRLSFLAKRGEGGAMVVRLAADDAVGGPSLLITSSGRVGHGGGGSWHYRATMPTGIWWQFRFSVDQTARTYDLHYRPEAADDWLEIGTDIRYESDHSFNTLDLFPHFGAEALPAHVYVDAIEAVSIPETDLTRERERRKEQRRQAVEEHTRRVREYWSSRRGRAGEYGEAITHTSMPPLPAETEDYANMWDPFVLRDPGTGTGLEIAAQTDSTDRITSRFDQLPWNGRQLVRDDQGRWLVLVEQEPGKIWLSWGAGTRDNPYKPRGGDLQAVALLGEAPSALLPGHTAACRASMAIGGGNRLHVVWHAPDGLWHTGAEAGGKATPALSDRRSWSKPRLLVAGACRAGDITRDASGAIVVSYSQDDTVYVRPVSGGEAEAVGGLGAGMPEMASRGGRIPKSERECQDSVMDLAPDGSIWLAFRRDLSIWVVRRTPEGKWERPEQVAREYAFHPSIMVAEGRPLVSFLHEGLRRIPLDLEGNLSRHSGGGPTIAYATLSEDGWHTGTIVSAEEVPVLRRGMWAQRNQG
ncbi:MAG: hypothetical protein HON70_27105, partial [Lentisphaerae bacterium]|nr:hypothetical protein [Lentisphaerota bacterium]